MTSYPGVLSRVLEYFTSDDPGYYDSLRFRRTVIEKLYASGVRQKIARAVKMPPGFERDDPDIDNLTEETFAQVRRKLDANLIAKCPTPDSRFKKCTGFVMTLAYHKGIDFKRKHPALWQHGEFNEELVGWEPSMEPAHKSIQAQFLAESQELAKESDAKDRLRKALGRKVTDTNFEIFWLATIERLKRREIQARFPKLTTNYIGVMVHRVLVAAAEILSDPVVLRRLLGGRNDKE